MAIPPLRSNRFICSIDKDTSIITNYSLPQIKLALVFLYKIKSYLTPKKGYTIRPAIPCSAKFYSGRSREHVTCLPPNIEGHLLKGYSEARAKIQRSKSEAGFARKRLFHQKGAPHMGVQLAKMQISSCHVLSVMSSHFPKMITLSVS